MTAQSRLWVLTVETARGRRHLLNRGGDETSTARASDGVNTPECCSESLKHQEKERLEGKIRAVMEDDGCEPVQHLHLVKSQVQRKEDIKMGLDLVLHHIS
ncbi:hypothetical protein F2P81_018536 [Scophthalmus maximus]|uniref:Uncharacterized protein n=1 Tax=Scophthalmus maximus TaxID=52904 RepID=A0A6A4SE71_SCOMX|nr:hypothetical protein F2P81_018536 [Scophthalmus maximus]